MATIVTRAGKGSALTHNEVDANFNNLNSAKVETSTISSFGATLVDDADAGAARTTLGLGTTDSPTFAALTSTGEITANGGIALGDNDKATFGAGDDLQIWHTGSSSVIADAGTGDLKIRANDLIIQSYALEHNFILADQGGAVTLYHNNAAKFATTSTGIDVTGAVTADGLTNSGNLDIVSSYPRINLTDTNNNPDWSIINANGILNFYDSTNAVNTLKLNATGIDVTGVITTDGLTTSADINFGDNDKAIFGAGSDLQIYHDGGTFNYCRRRHWVFSYTRRW